MRKVDKYAPTAQGHSSRTSNNQAIRLSGSTRCPGYSPSTTKPYRCPNRSTSTLTILSRFHMGLFMSLYFFWHSIIISRRLLCFRLLNAAPAGASLSVSMRTLHQWWLWDDPPLARLIDYVLTGIVLRKYRFIADMNSATNAIAQIVTIIQTRAIGRPHEQMTFDHACGSNLDAMLCAP